ncbi:hypothetical protein GCM10023339_72660 [Alloalcanivorax gelatiniphagus]
MGAGSYVAGARGRASSEGARIGAGTYDAEATGERHPKAHRCVRDRMTLGARRASSEGAQIGAGSYDAEAHAGARGGTVRARQTFAGMSPVTTKTTRLATDTAWSAMRS